MSNLVTWDKIMDTAMAMPLVKINRDSFLIESFQSYGDSSSLTNKRPIDLYGKEIINKVAKGVIDGHLLKVTGTSTAAGIPGGFAMFATVPADLAQFYWHAIVCSQKLAYIYGYPNLLDENKNVNEETRNQITLFIGVMLGAGAASKAVTELSKNIAVQVAKRLPQKALTKTSYYPIVKSVGKWIGMSVTKTTFAKGFSKVVPILGGVVSGGLTYATFKPMSKRLQMHLENDMQYHNTNAHHFTSEDESAEEKNDKSNKSEDIHVNLELIILMACINMAKIDFDLDQTEIDLITSMIDNSELSNDEQMLLLDGLRAKELFKFDLTSIKDNELYSIALVENLAAVIHADSIVKPSEKIYFSKIALELGFDKDQISEYLVLKVDEQLRIS
jgi:uncharacterized membrane protein YebE (DUF533 family)